MIERHTIPHGILAVFPIAFSLVTLIGHATGNPQLASVLSGEVTMKPATACGLIAAAVMEWNKSYNRAIVGHCAVFILALLTLSLFGRSHETSEIKTIGALVPSLSTIACFLAQIIALKYRCFALVAIAFSASSLLGYAIDQPLFYFYIPDFSTGMAINTAISFVCLGLASLFKDE